MTSEPSAGSRRAARFASEPVRIEVAPSDQTSFGPAVGVSVAMRTVFAILERVCTTDESVLFEGEAGTGKALLAQAIHQASPRRQQAFVTLDCRAAGREALEKDLFGQERGGGAFEKAHRGTLFLNEVGELPIAVQEKLARTIRAGAARRKSAASDVRLLSATSRNLRREIECGRFCEALFYELAAAPIAVPPLRTRREDIRPLVQLFSNDASRDGSIGEQTMLALEAHDWPGNVGELRSVVLSVVTARSSSDPFVPGRSYRETRSQFEADFERRYVKWLLLRHRGNVSAAAREAHMDRKYLYDLAKRHGVRG